MRSGHRPVVLDPNVLFDIDTQVPFTVDEYDVQRVRHDILASDGKYHSRPAFPLGDGTFDHHRPRSRTQHSGTYALMGADPRIDGQAVGTDPRGILAHRHGRVPM